MKPRLRPALLLAALAAALAAGRAPEPAAGDGPPLRLRPFVVEAKPLTCFGLSLQMVAVRDTKQILRMFVREVVPDSEAAFNGLVPGTEILSINGKSVDAYVVRFDPESELGRLLVNRRRGDRLQLRVVAPGETAARTVVLIAGRTGPFNPLESDWPW